MNGYLIIPFIAFCIQIVAIVYGLALKGRGRVYVAFVILSLLFAGWAFIDLLLWLPVPEQYADPLLRIQIPFFAFVGVAYIQLVYAYLHRTPDFSSRFFFWFAVSAVLIALPTDLVIAGFEKRRWGYSFVPGPLHAPAALIGALLPFIYGLYLLFRRTWITRDDKEKSELGRYVAGALVIAVVTLVVFVALPVLLDTEVQPLTHVVISVLQVLNIYSVFRYQIFSIGIQNAANDLFADASDGIVILGNTNRIVQANRRAHEILASEFPESLEVTVRTLLADRKQKRDAKTEFEVEVEKENGFRSFVNLTLSPVKHKDKHTGQLLQVRDVTEQRKARQRILDMNAKLEQARDEALGASQSKSRFLANMSHELRTPLNAIIGYSEMLREELEKTDNRQLVIDVDHIHIAGNHLLSVINNILDLSKIEAGKTDIHIDTFTVGGLARMVSAMVEPVIRKNDNTYTLDCPEDIGDMNTDIMKLRQSLINVLSNAGRFTKNGHVSLAIRREHTPQQQYIVFSVADSGIGIKAENLQKIFETFSQADDATTRLFGGSGLGLAISKRLIEILGGSISVESEPGKGSCFTLRVPAIYQSTTG